MHSPARHQRLGLIYLTASYFLISCLPFFSALQGRAPEHSWRLLGYELVSWLVLWAVFQAPRWFHWALLPAFFAIPVEIYLRLFYGQSISTHHLGIITETSPKEAAEFLGNAIYLLIGLIVLISLWWWSCWRVAKSQPQLAWRHGSRWFVIALIALSSLAWCYGRAVGVSSASASGSGSAETSTAEVDEEDSLQFIQIRNWEEAQAWIEQQAALPAWASVFYDEENFSHTWPLGIWVRAVDFIQERNYLASLSEKNRDFVFHAQQTIDHDQAQTIILVLGESSRYDRWGLNGYERDTTPHLKQESHLVSFTDMVTAVAATRLSVPLIMTRKPATQSLKPGFSEKSLISAYKEAGFYTYWLSNQMSFGQFDTPSSVIAKEADQTSFFNLGGFTNGSSLDEILLPAIEKAANDGHKKKLIVIHSLGNHWNYSHRYPKEYDRWKPSLFGIVKPAYTNLKNKEALNNSYDNSILYTDWFLGQIIEQLKKRAESTALFYVSDHGQTLYDGSCNLAFHGHNTQYEFHIPAFVWYSNVYAQRYPEKIAALRQNQNRALSTENVFHSMLDMVNIRYPDEHLERSVFSPLWRYSTRYVDSYGWSNYDDATLKGDCREVIDNGSPLVQEK
ncbi:MAG: sulfatase-like hydrolase/transferase [Burkholderiales bacterium]|nr:sulfatase-like hydrolase/transferase [Burkholderiales bacterium]